MRDHKLSHARPSTKRRKSKRYGAPLSSFNGLELPPRRELRPTSRVPGQSEALRPSALVAETVVALGWANSRMKKLYGEWISSPLVREAKATYPGSGVLPDDLQAALPTGVSDAWNGHAQWSVQSFA